MIQVYFNGDWIPNSELTLGVDDLGFLMGVTVTERLRTFHGEIFRLREHVERMRASLMVLGLDADKIVAQIETAVPEFITRNKPHLAQGDDWSIVAFATPGNSLGGDPTVVVHGFPLPFHQWAAFYNQGLTLWVSDIRQVPPSCWPPQLKCRSRMHYYLADRQAAAQEPDARAILLDQEGFLTETTTANIVLVCKEEGLLSPPADAILPGVSLGVVKELAEKLSLPFHERRLTVDDLQRADEVILTSTSGCLLPATRCNGQPVGNGTPGLQYRQLLAAWSALVGLDIVEQARQ